MYSEIRHQTERIWQAGVKAVKPQFCIPAALQALTPVVGGWRATRKYLVVGGGKAGAAMGHATEEYLLNHGVSSSCIHGWLNVLEGSQPKQLRSIHLHPARPASINFPTPAAVAGTLRLLEMVDQTEDETLILCLISGGGSALLCAPVSNVPLEDKVEVSKQLSGAGVGIEQLNAVRKHLSQIKGGGLARRCFPDSSKGSKRVQLVSLIISDVIGDPLDVIASGPTAPDPTTFADALKVLDTFGVEKQAPKSVRDYLLQGHDGLHAETLKAFPRPEPELVHRIIANNRLALEAATTEASRLGYEVINLGDRLQGDTLELAHFFKSQFRAWEERRPCCILSGGETTVRLPPNAGKGGRNQSMALALLQALGEAGLKNVCILCGGTDGEDGPTDAAGAFADPEGWNQSLKLNLSPAEYLNRHDAYPFFQKLDALFKTGLTETNVMDLRVFLLA